MPKPNSATTKSDAEKSDAEKFDARKSNAPSPTLTADAARARHAALSAEIAEADRADSDSTYYERWLAAFEHLLIEKGLVSQEELAARVEDFESGRRDDAF